jgi:hypothetical protein
MYRRELFHDLDLSRDAAIDTDICKYVTYTGLELMPWSRVLLDELILSYELVKRFHSFHGSE